MSWNPSLQIIHDGQYLLSVINYHNNYRASVQEKFVLNATTLSIPLVGLLFPFSLDYDIYDVVLVLVWFCLHVFNVQACWFLVLFLFCFLMCLLLHFERIHNLFSCIGVRVVLFRLCWFVIMLCCCWINGSVLCLFCLFLLCLNRIIPWVRRHSYVVPFPIFHSIYFDMPLLVTFVL